MTEKNIGDKLRLTSTFRNINSVLTTPTTVTFVLKEPDETKTTYISGVNAEIVTESEGVLHVDWSITQEGVHNYEFKGVGLVDTAEEGSFRVRRRAVA